MFVLQNNVEVVLGAKYACIYDLNSLKLYRADIDMARKILRASDEKENTETLFLKSEWDYLCSAGIFVEKDNLLPKIERTEYTVDFSWIEITQNCNLMCRHCYESASRELHKTEMPMEVFESVVDRLVEAGIRRIQLVGGEPLAHSCIEQMIKYVSGKFSLIEIFTNGTLLNDKLLDLIASNGISLAFSVYSEDPEIHDGVTCTKGSFFLTNKNIAHAVSMGIPVRTASVEMMDTPRFKLTSMNVMHKTDFPRLTGRANLALYSRDMLKRKIITKNVFKKPINRELFFKSKSVHNCFGEMIYIDVGLNVYPCAMERRVCYGNLGVTSVQKIVGNEFMRMNKDKVQGCRDCEYRYACFDCRSDANGASIDAKPWYCSYDPIKGVWIDPDAFVDELLLKTKKT